MIFKNISVSIPMVERSEITGVITYFQKIYTFPSKLFNLLKGSTLLFVDKIRLLKNRENIVGDQHLENVGQRFTPKKYFKSIALVTVIVIVLLGLVKILDNYKSKGSSGEVIDVGSARSSIDFNKEFVFPLKNDKGEEVAKLKYLIEKAELRDEIVVKGQRAKAIKGRTFLILNLKIANEFNQSIEIKSRDYVRLSVNGNKDEWLAPDIHNDPVEVQAISTKYTRIGFPINDTDHDLVIRVGEINGDKEEIALQF